MRESRFDVLFEPVQLGPVTARNRFFQVPHCNGMGHHHPTAHAEMRGVKAEGGWAVVCTEEVEFHHTSEVAPYVEGRIWDDADIPMHARLVERVHEHGSLAGIELAYSGMIASNLYSRESPMGPAHLAVQGTDPVQARRMDRRDIDDLRRWHRQGGRPLAAGRLRPGLRLRGARADRDPALPLAPLQRPHRRVRRQHREPRAAAARDPRGHAGGGGRPRRGRLPDLRRRADRRRRASSAARSRRCSASSASCPTCGTSWSATGTSTRSRRGSPRRALQERYVRDLKRLTTKPVVGVGRFTSADTMVRMIRDGVLDMIGSARPSIADPFLPKKIEEGRWEDIRECIGCNICVTGDFTITPLRCTQNPSMGEEWRRGWHPERIRAKASESRRAGGRRRAVRPGGGALARQARLRRGAGRGNGRAGRPGRAGVAAARAVGVDPRARLSQVAAGAAGQRRAGVRQRADRRRDRVVRVRPRGPGHRRALAGRRRRALAHQPDRDRRRHAGAHARRPDGRAHAGRGARRPVRRRPLLHGRRARRAARGGGARRDAGHAGGPGVGLDAGDDGAAQDPEGGCSRPRSR